MILVPHIPQNKEFRANSLHELYSFELIAYARLENRKLQWFSVPGAEDTFYVRHKLVNLYGYEVESYVRRSLSPPAHLGDSVPF